MNDIELLRQYAQDSSEEAFTFLVTRHVNLVFSAALRSTGNPAHAEEITQAVFVILARKARKLREGTALSGWLYQTTRFTAANFRRSEIQRVRREQEAHMQSLLNEPEPDVWPELAPMLDAAMTALGKKDRDAIVFRFFEGRNIRSVAEALGSSEEAAKKRISRAVEKLRRFFIRRGAALSVAGLTAAISANAVQAAPSSVAASAATAALVGGPETVAALATGTIKLMAWAKAKFALRLGAAVSVGAGAIALALSASSPENLSAAAILKKVENKYTSLSSYSETMETVLETQLSGSAPQRGGKTISSDSVKLARPDLYRMETEGSSSSNRFAIWSAGDGEFWMLSNNQLYRTRDPNPNTPISPFFALPTATVPAAFFARKDRSTLAALVASGKLRRQADERLEGVDCFTVSGSARIEGVPGGETVLWVGKQDFLVRRVRCLLIVANQPPRYSYTNTVIQTHRDIQINGSLSKSDFTPQVPAGVQRIEHAP